MPLMIKVLYMLILRAFTAILVIQPSEKRCSSIVWQLQTHKHQINAVIWQDKGSVSASASVSLNSSQCHNKLATGIPDNQITFSGHKYPLCICICSSMVSACEINNNHDQESCTAFLHQICFAYPVSCKKRDIHTCIPLLSTICTNFQL